MNDVSHKVHASKAGLGSMTFSLAVILVGTLLTLGSLLPLGDFAKEALWSEGDAVLYSRVSEEYHRISYQTPARAGLTEGQLMDQIERTKTQFEALRTKLQYARQQPLAWKRYLLWTGVLLTACGFVSHLASDRK